MRAPCSICGEPSIARRLCIKHYSRFQNHGDPLAGRIGNGVALRWLHEHASFGAADYCLIWPYARDDVGYGRVKYDGKIMGAHRAMCMIVHGAPPTPLHQAAHSCGRGNEGCVNPHHLRWATPKENAEDKLVHQAAGISPVRPARLSDADCELIRASKGRVKQRDLADRFGVSEALISRIINNKIRLPLAKTSEAA
jgi:hypothetical protein